METQDDLTFMASPDLWPAIILPLKRWSGNKMDVAILLTDDGSNYMLGEGQCMFEPLDTNLLTEPFPPSELLERVVVKGWRVD